MSAAAIESTIILVARYGPQVIEAIISLWSKKDPTVDDWKQLLEIVNKPIASVADMPVGSRG
jgi:hypothetical protein